MDKLVVDLKGVVIQLPNSHVIVNRDEYDDLKSNADKGKYMTCLLYTSPSPRDVEESRMPSSA